LPCFFLLFSYNGDVCAELQKAGHPCPLKSGPQTIVTSLSTSAAPSGTFSVRATAKTSDGKQIMCTNFKFQIDSNQRVRPHLLPFQCCYPHVCDRLSLPSPTPPSCRCLVSASNLSSVFLILIRCVTLFLNAAQVRRLPFHVRQVAKLS
jgi:hypothetical protein